MRIVDGSNARLNVDRNTVIVCVPLIGAQQQLQHALATIASVLAYSDRAPQIALAGTNDVLEPISRRSAHLPADAVLGVQVPAGAAEAQLLQTLLDACAPADVVLLAPGVLVHPQWLRRLRAAAASDTVIASASPLFNAGRDAADAIAGSSLRLRPRIARISSRCALILRPALDLVRAREGAAGDLAEALRELSEHLGALGMLHVAADDVAVQLPRDTRATSERVATALGELAGTDENALDEDRGPLPRAIRRGCTSLRPLDVTIDARSLAGTTGGTQTYILELALALAGDSRVRLRALVPPNLSPQAASALESGMIELITPRQAAAMGDRAQVVHRPQQISSVEDFSILRTVGERLVTTHHDLIAYHNASYHRDLETWLRYREITRAALACSDRVLFPSQHALRDAIAEDLLTDDRASVVATGATERLEPQQQTPCPPAQLAAATRPFILCLGADYAHKNRPFAIRMLIELHALAWQGTLVLAGPHVPYGSSRAEEAELLDGHPQLRAHVIDLGPVDEATKSWLLSHACALIYPSICEGFGLLPLEAARSRIPCLYAPQASLAELGADAATLVPWNAAASAAAALPLLSDGRKREAHLDSLSKLAVPSWSDIVEQLLDVYQLAATGPRTAGSVLHPERHLNLLHQLRDAKRELSYHRDLAQDYQDALHALEERVSLGLPLIDRGGLLTQAQQRGLMRVAARRPFAALALAPFQLIGTLGSPQRDDLRGSNDETP